MEPLTLGPVWSCFPGAVECIVGLFTALFKFPRTSRKMIYEVNGVCTEVLASIVSYFFNAMGNNKSSPLISPSLSSFPSFHSFVLSIHSFAFSHFPFSFFLSFIPSYFPFHSFTLLLAFPLLFHSFITSYSPPPFYN